MRAVILASIVILSMVVTSCIDKDPIRIGFVGGLTGRNGDLGVAGRDGALFAIEEINASGGINGRKLELIIRDDGSDPVRVVAAVGELVESGASAIVGPMTSAMAAASIQVANRGRVLMISPTVSGSGADFTGIDDHFVRLNINSDTATATADHMLLKLGAKRVALLYDSANRSYSESLVNVFKSRYLANGGTIAAEIPFSSKEKPDLSALAQRAQAGKPDAILIVAGALDSAIICQHLKKLLPKAPVFISEWAGTGEFIKAAGSSASGVYIHQHFNNDSTAPTFLAFAASYKKRFGDTPSFAASYSYEAVSIISAALRKEFLPSRLKENIISLGRFKGVQGDILIDRFGDPQRAFSLMQIRGGGYAVID